jgi:hypothetical protein
MVDAVSVSTLLPTWAALPGVGIDTRVTDPKQAAHGFESLFVQTLLDHAGMAKALGGSEDGQGALGELLIRELSQTLAQQLTLQWGASLGVVSSQSGAAPGDRP